MMALTPGNEVKAETHGDKDGQSAGLLGDNGSQGKLPEDRLNPKVLVLLLQVSMQGGRVPRGGQTSQTQHALMASRQLQRVRVMARMGPW